MGHGGIFPFSDFLPNTTARCPTLLLLLSYGKHQYTMEAPMYFPLSGQVEIKASDKFYLTPALQPAFANITLTGDGDIYVNDERKAATTWSGRLMPGQYKVEVKKASHRPSLAPIEVKAGEDKTIPLQAPMPIYGSLNISATVEAAIFIDGVKQKETSPAIIQKVLIGNHEIELQAGGQSDKQSVEVQEGKIAEVNSALQEAHHNEDFKALNRQGYQYEQEKNYTEAAKCYQKAAQGGYAVAQYNLGLLYEFGYGVKKSKQEAKKWYQKAAAQGRREAV
jgi:tetratricopeptide (TPR) repeat protein